MFKLAAQRTRREATNPSPIARRTCWVCLVTPAKHAVAANTTFSRVIVCVPSDLLLSSRVVDADAPPGTEATGMDDLQLCDELKTMLLAGHETSSMALTWALYLLVTHPEAMAKARAEVREQLPAGDGYGSMQQYKACTYLNHCLLEALRLFNPVPTIPRELVKDEVLCGKRIPAGVRGVLVLGCAAPISLTVGCPSSWGRA